MKRVTFFETQYRSIIYRLLGKCNVKVTNKINIARFKERLLPACLDLNAVPRGRDILLTYRENMGEALQ